MSDDVLITPASRKIEFKDSGGNVDGTIALSAGGNLQITSTGTIEIGDISEDIHIGNGTEAVDIVFDYASRIYSVANQDLTIGKGTLGGNNVTIDGASEILLSLAGTTELKLTDDFLTLTPGNEDVAGYAFRNRNDLGMFESGYFCAIKAPESVFIQIDSNSNNTDKVFAVQKDGSGMGNGTELFRVQEDGHVIIRQAVANPTFLVHADTDTSPAPRIEMMRGAHDTWGTGDNYNDWRIQNENHMRFYSGTSSVSSGAAVERFEILSDGSGITINNAFVIPGSAGSSGQVLKWPSSGTVLEWADESGGGGGMTSFQLEDGDGTEVTISDGKEVKFVEGTGIEINWTDTSPGSNADPYDMTFTVDVSDFMSNGSNNRVVTATGTDGMNAEANLVFDGTGLGIGTSTIPHGSKGTAKLAIEGTNQNVAGPHIQTTTASDNYPLLQILSWQHDNISLNFDAWYTPTDGWTSSDAGSNFQIYKHSDSLKFRYDSGVAADADITWNEGFHLTKSGELDVYVGFRPRKAVISTISSNTVLGAANSGGTFYWTGGSLTLPANATVGMQVVVINNTGSSATPGLGSNNAIASGWTAHSAMADETARTYICPVADKWIYIG